jgi:regulator of sigma E protease
MIITILAFIFVFGLLVFVHELGHFIAAKTFGVEVKTFAFGFPPRLWSKKIGETTYAINALPLGGYVSLRGEDEYDLYNDIAKKLGEEMTDQQYQKALKEAKSKERQNPASLLSKKPWQLITIFISGVAMNIVLAIVLLYICFMVGFQPIFGDMWQHPGITNSLKVVATEVEKNTPAEKEGIKSGDVIRSVDGVNYYTSTDILTVIRSKNTTDGAQVALVIERDGQLIHKTLSTYKAKVATKSGEEKEVNRIGIVLENAGSIRGNLISSFGASTSEVIKATKLTFTGVFDLFGQLITKFKLSENISGPVGIVVATDYFAKLGFVYLIQFAFVLSVSLAVFNVLPIPGLDGGHIAIVLTETISKRRFSTKTKNAIQLVGFGSLILLMVAVSVKDFIDFDIIGMITGVFK